MSKHLRQGWVNIAHPYNFVLQEGSKITENPLDYMLLFIHIQTRDIISSPGKPPRNFAVQFSMNAVGTQIN